MKSQNDWDNPHSFIESKTDDFGVQVFSGAFFHNGIEFRIRAKQQQNAKYLIRGHIKVVSPKDGHTMEVKPIKIPIEMASPLISSKKDSSSSKIKLQAEFYSQDNKIDHLKLKITSACLKLYEKHAQQIHREYGEVSRPHTIIPSIAAHNYVDAFLDINHRKASAVRRKSLRKTLIAICCKLPCIPMADFKVNTLRPYLKTLSKDTQKLLRNFWTYCLDAKKCNGNLPFPPVENNNVAFERALLSANRPGYLELEEQDKLFDYIYEHPTSANCGVALQLWGGYSAKDACEFKWGDVLWSNTRDDYVRIRYYRPDLTSATHDYTVPLFPQGALLLSKRYQILKAQYPSASLKHMPIVSQIKDFEKKMDKDALVQYSKKLLHTIGISYALTTLLHKADPSTAVSSRFLHNTYIYNINVLCNLSNDYGTSKYLSHESLQASVTDDHYICFSDDFAGERLFTLLSTIKPLKNLEVNDDPILLPDGNTQYVLHPKTTRHTRGLVGDFILPPNTEIVIKCIHGVTGSVSARGFTEKGTLRRKKHN